MNADETLIIAPDEGVTDGDVTMGELNITFTEDFAGEAVSDEMIGDLSDEVIYDEEAIYDEDAIYDQEAIYDEEAVYTDEVITGDINYGDEGFIEEGMIMDPGFDMGMGAGEEVKDPLLSSWFFVLGITGAVLFVSIVLGTLLARRKIKKGIDLYEG